MARWRERSCSRSGSTPPRSTTAARSGVSTSFTAGFTPWATDHRRSPPSSPAHPGGGRADWRPSGAPPCRPAPNPEDDFARFLRRHDLPEPELNQRIAGHEVDAAWRAHRLVVELDGAAFHQTPDAFERDRERDADLLDAGFSTLRITHRRLKHAAAREAARLRALLGG